MKFISICRSLFSKQTLPTRISFQKDNVLNYSESHEYSTVDRSSTNEYSCHPSSHASPSYVKRIIICHRVDGFLQLKAVVEAQLITQTIDTSRYSSFLCDSVVDFVEVRGVVTDSLLRWLGALRVLTALQINDAKINCSPIVLYRVLRSVFLQSLCFHRCKFSDAQIISDELFVQNPQISMFEVISIDGYQQSFPLLTDRALLRWCASKVPRKILLHQVETSITIHGIRNLIETGLEQQHSLSWSFGQICSNAENSVREMRECRKIYTILQVLHIHRTYIQVISDSPKLYVLLYTSEEKVSNEELR